MHCAENKPQAFIDRRVPSRSHNVHVRPTSSKPHLSLKQIEHACQEATDQQTKEVSFVQVDEPDAVALPERE
jgi:hypothetical protein